MRVSIMTGRVTLVSASQATDGGGRGTGSPTGAPAGEVAVPAGGHEAAAEIQELRSARAGLTHPGDYLIYQESGTCHTVALVRELTRVGRSLVADLRFDDPTVSRRHALIVRELTGLRVLDDRSMYGVFVNGERVDSRLLTDGDVIAIGSHQLLYQRIAAPRRRPRRRPPSALPTAPRPSRS
jgi:pSer/pThr/pTyr-binding forkhead associated (FHA) protein